MTDIDQLLQMGLDRIVAGGRVTTEAVLRERLAICGPCEKRKGLFCGQCKCTRPINGALAAAQCPDVPPRWLAVAMPEHPVDSVWFFERPGNAEKLLADIAGWVGTRFWDGARGRALKGVKADCISFVGAVMTRAGALGPFDWPKYVTHHGGAGMFQVLLGAIEREPKLVRVWSNKEGPRPALMVGDMLIGTSGRAMHHAAVMGRDNQVWHCLMGAGVCQGTLQDPVISDHLVAVYRFLA